jgi:hypothetical protein
MSERFVYHRLGKDYPTTVDIDAWVERDEQLRGLRDELAQEAGREEADWYPAYLLTTALGDRLDLFLNAQCESLAGVHDALNLVGLLGELLIRSPDMDPAVMRQLAATFAALGTAWSAPDIGFDREVNRAERVRGIMATLAVRLTERLRFTKDATQICCRALTSDGFLVPPPAEGNPLENPVRLAVLERWAREMLDDMRDAYLRRYEEDEGFVRRIIGERVVKRFPWARESARAMHARQTERLRELIAPDEGR